ncbi:CAMK/CAMKL protein kinase, partial [Sphaeroforma arctica JP610]
MQVMTLLDHPNIVKLYELTDTTDHFLLILEYVAGSNLTEKVPLFATTKRKKLEPLVRKLMRQIMSAIAYCHKGHVVHRDIKPDNVMLDEDMNVKLADWGFSNISTDLLSTHCGTPYYASPELFRPHAYLGPPSDVWACGVLLYYMYVGKLPFRQDPIKEYIKKAKYQIPKSMPTTLAALIKAMLVVDPNQRLTAVDVLNSEWIQEGVPIPRSLVASGRAGMPRSTSVIFDQKSGKNSAIHDDVVALMTVHLGFTQQEVHESLQNNSYNQITATYYLLRDSPKLSQFRKFLLHTSSPAVTSEDHNSTKLFVIKESGGKNRSDGDVVKKTPQRKRSGSNRLLGFMFNRKTHTGTESPDTPSRVPDDRTDDVQFEKSFTALKGMRSGGSGMSGSIGGQQRGSNPGMHSQQSTQYLTNRRHSVQPMADVNPQDVPIRGKLGPSKSFEMGGSPQVMGMSSENIDYDDTQQQQHVEMQQQQVMLVQQQHHHQISPRSPRDFGDQVVDGNSPRGYMNGSRNLNESPRDYGSSSVSSHPRTGSHPGLNRRSSGGRIEDQLIKQQQTSSQTTYYQAMQYDAQYAAPQPVPRPDR